MINLRCLPMSTRYKIYIAFHNRNGIIQKFEVSNAQYLEFVNAKLKEDSAMGKSMLPDTLVWRKVTPLGNEPYVEYYFRHSAYAHYPVVGVSYAQAKAFAEWKTEQYNQQEGRVFKKVQFRLPTEEEWEYAAKGAPYSYLPWNAPNTIDEKGQPRANFKMVSQLSIYRDTMHDPFYYHLETTEPKTRVYWLSNGQQYIPNRGEKRQKYSYYNDVLTPVESYEPNVHDLYQMAGNVEEMVDAYYDRDPNLYSFSHERLPPYDKPWGVTKGGSWNDPGFYLQYPIRQFYEDEHSASAEIGFRLVMVVLEY